MAVEEAPSRSGMAAILLCAEWQPAVLLQETRGMCLRTAFPNFVVGLMSHELTLKSTRIRGTFPISFIGEKRATTTVRIVTLDLTRQEDLDVIKASSISKNTALVYSTHRLVY